MTPTDAQQTGSIITWWWDRGRTRHVERLTEVNRQLTSMAGFVLMPLMGLVFVTGLVMDMYWHVHYVIGFILIPIVALKVATTGYRAFSYYIGRSSYRAVGPPELPLRLLAPILVISTITALATGVALWAQHSRSGTLATLHTDSAVICAVTIGIHVLAYIPRVCAEAWLAARKMLTRIGGIRVVIVLIALVAGIALAVVTYSNGTWPAREYRPTNLVRTDG